MRTTSLSLVFLVLATCIYAASPTIAIKGKSTIPSIKNGCYNFHQAVDTTTGETLVTWDQNGPLLLGAVINPRGKLIGKLFTIGQGGNYGSSSAYNPVQQEYFVAYSPEKVGSIFAVRLDRYGKVIGKEITILKGINPPKPNDLGDNSFPYLIFNPKTNGYIMIWEKTEGMAAALLDKNGKLTSATKIIMNNPGSNGFYDKDRTAIGRIQDVQWLASGKKLLVVFQQHFSDIEIDDWLAEIDPLLKTPPIVSKINTSPIVTAGAFWDTDASLGILPDDTACVFYADNQMVMERTIDNKGKFTSPPFPAFSGSIDTQLTGPKVAFSTTSEGIVGLLVAYDAAFSPVIPTNGWAQVLNDHGRPVGKAKMVDTFQNSVTTGTLLFAIPRKPSDTLFQFIWMENRAGGYGGPDNILKLNLQVTP